MDLTTRHHFTVDVEEYYQVSAFERYVDRERWGDFETRVEACIDRILGLLDRHRARGTFFVLGCVAERLPGMVRAIAAAGHEIASHGWDHRRIPDQTPEAFRLSVRKTKALLEDLCGVPVHGFRAPSFSITQEFEWALDVLIEEGHTYDSSLFPVRRPGYGYADGDRDPYWLERPAGRIQEIPPATLRLAGVNLPAAGGAYFRLLPYSLVRAALKECADRGVPGTFYIHPWELDPGQPRIGVPWSTRIRHYGGLERTAPRLERLLSEFRFTSIAERFVTPTPAGAP